MKSVHKRARIATLTLGLAVAWIQPLLAIPIAPGEPGDLLGSEPPAGVVLDTRVTSFELRDDDDPSVVLSTGTLDSRVVEEDGTGLLRFEYQVFVDADSPGHVEFLSVSNFTSFTTDVDFSMGESTDIAPTGALRSVNGAFVSFFFPGSGTGGGVQPGESTPPLFVRTDASRFDTDGLERLQQDLNTEDFMSAFQPSSIPEPSAGALLFFAALGLGMLRVRRD